MVYAINKFREYITGYLVYIHTSQSAIKFLMNKYDFNAIIIRWILLQEFDITILDNLGKHNVVTKFVSRLTHDADRDLVDDAFLDEHLFVISIQTPFFYDKKKLLGNKTTTKTFELLREMQDH